MNLSDIPDSLKVAAATSPSLLTFMGIPMEQWTYAASVVVSIMFIIEKVPTMAERVKQVITWAKRVKRKKHK